MATLLCRQAQTGDHLPGAAQTFHGNDANFSTIHLGQELGLKAAVMGIRHIDGKLAGIPRKVMGQHLLQNVRAFVTGEANEANLAGLLRRHRRFDGPIGLEDPVGVVIVVDLVELPDVDHIGLQSAQAIVQLCFGGFAVTGADLGHQRHLIAPIVEGQPHPPLGFAIVIFLGGVHKGHACSNGRVYQFYRCLFVKRGTNKVTAAKADDRNFHPGFAQRTDRDTRAVSFDLLIHCFSFGFILS